jgi:hypothetical protein
MRGKYGHFTGAHGPGSCDAAAAPGEHVAGGWSSHGGGHPEPEAVLAGFGAGSFT